ncbi:MAG: hypothetical protein HY961_18630 [Ignavibacteriae bacterium]|nr:hypothetical protein [Ignavibacteriota bacterium]
MVETLPDEQQEMLIDILHKRRIEKWRKEMAKEASKDIEDFHAGKLEGKSVEEIMRNVRSSSNDSSEA